MMYDLSTLTFLDLWNEYNNYMKEKLKTQTYTKITNNIKNHFSKYLVKDITAKIYVNWQIQVEEKDYKYSFKSNLHTSMVSILNYAVKFYDLKSNIASKVGGFNKRKEKVKNVNFWTIDEYKKFISVVDDDLYKLFFSTLFFTGVRLGECIALNWTDFKDGYLDINKTISKEKDSSGNYVFNSPKTPSSFRKIKLDNCLVSSFNNLYKKEKLKSDFNDKWFIFGGKKPLTQTTIGRRKNLYCDIAGVKKIRLHDFRHSHATLLLSQGVPITVISQRLGHSNINMTLNTYSHLVPTDEIKAINIINSIKSNNNLI